MNIKFQFTGLATPQQNSYVEVGFATLPGRSRVFLIHANVPMEQRYNLFSEVAQFATMLDKMVLTEVNRETKMRLEHFGNKLPEWTKVMRTWGEAGVVKVKTDTTPKLFERGITCMFDGYSNSHSFDVYRM